MIKIFLLYALNGVIIDKERKKTANKYQEVGIPNLV